MRGRNLFSLMKPIICILVLINRAMPFCFRTFLLVIYRHVPGKLGVGVRFALLKSILTSCGDCVAVFEGAYLYGMRKATMGNNVSIHPLCYIDATGGLVIGSDVSIAHATTIMTTEHDYSKPGIPIREAPCLPGSVHIGSDVSDRSRRTHPLRCNYRRSCRHRRWRCRHQRYPFAYYSCGGACTSINFTCE